MHTVTELATFRRDAKAAGMSEEDILALVEYVATTPLAGDEIEGTGGCRKLRFALKASKKGKSGGVRTITFYSGDMMPVFLITVFTKNQKVTLSKREKNGLKKLTNKLVTEYATRIFPIAAGERE